MARPKAAKWLLPAVAVIVGVAGSVGIVQSFGRDAEKPPPDTGATFALVSVDQRLAAGEPFEVRFDSRNAADRERLRPSLALGLSLSRNDEKLYTLVSNVGGEAHAVRADQPIGLPDVDLRGPTALKYRLPEGLDSGYYQLCGVIGFDRLGNGTYTRDPFCKTITVDAT